MLAPLVCRLVWVVCLSSAKSRVVVRLARRVKLARQQAGALRGAEATLRLELPQSASPNQTTSRPERRSPINRKREAAAAAHKLHERASLMSRRLHPLSANRIQRYRRLPQR